MHGTVSRGAAAALLALSIAATASAQSAPPAPVAPARPREARELRADSVIVRAFGIGRMDTIAVLFRALDHEEYGSPAWIEMTHKLDSLVMAGSARIMVRGGEGSLPRFRMTSPRGWVGFNAQGPMRRSVDENGDRVTYFAYPSILSVDPGSPADKAGIVPGDLLIAFNGTDVVGKEFNLTKLFVPERKVGVTVRRDGDTRDYSLDVVRAPEPVNSRRMEFSRIPMPPMPPDAPGMVRVEISSKGERPERGEGPRRVMVAPRMPEGPAGLLMAGRFSVITPQGVWGANVSAVGENLAKALKLEKGVLVNEVPEASPGYKAGLRAGDVIVGASGQPVATLGQLQDQVLSRLAERTIVLKLVRDRKPLAITVTW